MPVSTILRKSQRLGMSPSRTISLRALYYKALGSSLPNATEVLPKTPLGLMSGIGILRHLSVTPNLHVFAKLTSLISKLIVEPDMPEKPAQHKHAEGEDRAELETLHEEIIRESTSTFLEGYNNDLNVLVQQVKPPLKDIPKSSLLGLAKRTYKKKERARKAKERLRFFHFDKLCRPMVTSTFKSTYEFLHSLDVPCDELQYFPDVQRMTKDEIVMCVERLKTYRIHRIFSLFLIQRTMAEMQIGITAGNPLKMRDGRTPVPHLSQVKLYLSLCEMLDRPDLDIIWLLDMLTEANGYESMATLQTKVRKLLSVGATPKVIWENLELLTISKDIFNRKIKLYKRSRPSSDSLFPVSLFLIRSFLEFQERLNVGQDVLDLADLLDTKTEDFQACWGFKRLNQPELVQKVRMCTKVGIPKKDVFNNLSILDNIPMEKCYEVTTSFLESGLPPSIFIFREMAQANRANSRSQAEDRHPGWTETASQSQSQQKTTPGDDSDNWNTLSISNATKKTSALSNQVKYDSVLEETEENDKSVARKQLQTKAASNITSGSKSKSSSPASSYNSVESSKRSRRVLFNLVSHLLDLDPQALSAMFRCSISTTGVTRLDVTHNFELLTSESSPSKFIFTKHELSQCPLILIHPHTKLKAVLRKSPDLVQAYLYSSSQATMLPYSLPSGEDAFSLWDDVEEDEDILGADSNESVVPDGEIPSTFNKDDWDSESSKLMTLSSSPSEDPNLTVSTHQELLQHHLFSCPIRRLNLLQYLLERDSSFRLGVSGAHVPSGFLNKPL